MGEVVRDRSVSLEEQICDIFMEESFDVAVKKAVKLVEQETFDEILTRLRQWTPSDDYEDVGVAIGMIESWSES